MFSLQDLIDDQARELAGQFAAEAGSTVQDMHTHKEEDGSTSWQTKHAHGDYVWQSQERAEGEAVVLGEGQLNWNRSERVSDRYGCVGVYKDAHWKNSANLQGARHAGKLGQLRAVVLETCDADHIGDLTHGWHVGGAQVGEVYVLGEGRLFFVDDSGHKVGIRPEDGREKLWLDGPSLYRCHSQTVRLEFVPCEVWVASR